MSSFTKKFLEIHVALDTDASGKGGTARVIRNLATDVTINKFGLPDLARARVKVWGLKYEEMAELTRLNFLPLESNRNKICIMAGEEGNELSCAFRGEISRASADFNSAPDVCFELEAECGAYPMQMAAGPLAVNGNAPLADLLRLLAGNMGYAFRNEGVTSQLLNAVLEGSALEKAMEAAAQAGADLLVDDDTLILLRRDQARSGEVVTLSGESGMIGYPTFTNDGIRVRALYNPGFLLGGLVRVNSIVPRASGEWKITSLSHSLSANNPLGGPWESSMEGIFA